MKKGFTLVELLAVIVILSLIALVIVPVVSNIVENSRRNAASISASNYIDAVKNTIAMGVVNPNIVFADGDYSVATLKDDYGITVKGEYPTEGGVTITNKEVVSATICINKYSVTYSNGIFRVLGKCGQAGYDASMVTYKDTYVSNALDDLRSKLSD